jgi:hypothetical protein
MYSTRLRLGRTIRLAAIALAFLVVLPMTLAAQRPEVRVIADGGGTKLQVNGEDFMVLGMNWDYYPIGTTTTYNFWGQPDEIIVAALAREMPLLQNMGVNAIRVYVGIPKRWVNYIYEQYGIFTILNHAVGRYGHNVYGVYDPNTDYSDPRVREAILAEVSEMVAEFQDSPGVLMWLLGNENNYGLVWSSAETEALPEGERDAARARHLYSLFGEVVQAVKAIDATRPVAMANGDLQYLDIIAEEVPGLDVFGSNVYRGISFRDLFDRVEATLGIPVMLTEFGADAFNAKELEEDQVTQARYLLAQWREIYENSYGKGLAGNAIGGLTFQWSDGWWKYRQTERLDIQDINASWPNDAYPEDYVEGRNNMNEEWWGITAKGRPDGKGLYELFPRAAYYALKDAYTLDPYGPETDLGAINAHFSSLDPQQAALAARADQAALGVNKLGPVRLSEVRMELETYSTGGERISTPDNPVEGSDQRPSFQGFDHLESFYVTAAVEPKPNFTGFMSVNILGNVPGNPIDEIFYENRGRTKTIQTADGSLALEDLERVKMYQAGFSWEDQSFRLEAFYRTGHYHWAYEGDFFNLYREANYGPNLDIYNGAAPLGVEFYGKGTLEGLALAFGPELWWGANPSLLAKYQRQIGPFLTTGLFQEDFQRSLTLNASFAVPPPENRRATIHVETEVGPFEVNLGGLWGGSKLEGRAFQIADGESGDYRLLEDEVQSSDTWGGKARVSFSSGRWNWYVQGAAMSLVASGGGFDQDQIFTGWTLKDSGSGNQWNVISGFTYSMGDFQIAPNFLWQKPLVGPIPSDVPDPGRPRNIIDDPFIVRANRETTAGELLLTYDPTPATWMYDWDSDEKEDANFAASVGFTYRHHPTTQDAAIGFLADGRTPFAFPGAPPAQDLWEVRARLISKANPTVGWIMNLYGGTGQANGDDVRLVKRYGAEGRVLWSAFKFGAAARVNDWGPYDYHRDFNYTFPLQLTGDISRSFDLPGWFDNPNTRFGIRGTYRTLNEYSNRYCPGTVPEPDGTATCDATLPGDNGREWEIRTYFQVGF